MAFIPLYDTNPLRHIRRPWVAWSIIAANILVYFFVEFGGFIGEPPVASAISFGLIPGVFNGLFDRPIELDVVHDGLTLVTYSFLHGDFWHLAGNMIFLWVFADNVEDALGHFRYFVFYLLTAIAAGYAFVLSDPASQAPVIGASGAVGGNIGAYLLLHPRAKIWVLLFLRIPLRLRAVWVLGFWIVFQFFSAVTGGGDEEVAWWAHIGGVLAGAFLVLFMRQPGVPLFAAPPNEPTPRAAPQQRPEQAGPPVDPPVAPPRSDGGPWG